MHFYAFEIEFHKKENFKSMVKDFGLKYRFDYKMKRWEIFGKKLGVKKLKTLEDEFGECWAWRTAGTKQDPYSKSVYRKKDIGK